MVNVWKKQTTRYRLNGRIVPKGTPKAERETVESKRFYGTLKTSDGKRKQIPLTDDVKTSRTLLERLQADENRFLAHGIGKRERERQKPLAEFLNEYENVLRNRGNTADHVLQQMKRIRFLVSAMKAKTVDDLDGGRIGKTLSNWRERGRSDGQRKTQPLSVATSNHYVRALKGFSRWLWLEKRTEDDVLRNLHLMNGRADRKRQRRALTTDELSRLLEATADSGKVLCGFRPADRSMLYLLASYTGLRASELASLSVSSFDLDASTVTVEAGYSKRRRKDVLPLHPSLVSRLSVWLKTKDGTLWPDGWAKRKRGASILKRDLQRAGIEYVDAHGKTVDFHALRHTFISSLARSGVHPAKAKELARHSTITLTMDVYSHVETDELRDALGSLPDVP